MVWIIILILVILLLVWLNRAQRMNNVEGFDWDPLSVGQQSDNCYKQNLNDCLKYSNCGICHQGAKLQCKPGNVDGPFFDERCNGWTYTNYYDRHIFKEAVTTTTPSWSKFYPQDYEIWFPMPSDTAALQSFKEQATPPPRSNI